LALHNKGKAGGGESDALIRVDDRCCHCCGKRGEDDSSWAVSRESRHLASCFKFLLRAMRDMSTVASMFPSHKCHELKLMPIYYSNHLRSNCTITRLGLLCWSHRDPCVLSSTCDKLAGPIGYPAYEFDK
jgi:hypothetical protein